VITKEAAPDLDILRAHQMRRTAPGKTILPGLPPDPELRPGSTAQVAENRTSRIGEIHELRTGRLSRAHRCLKAALLGAAARWLRQP